MHEMTIASELLQTVLAVAAENGADRVEEIEVALGAMRLVVPEALELAWSVLTEGTAAEGSRLKTVEVAIRGRCRLCGAPFEPKIADFLCPRCGQADVEITEGDEIVLTSVLCRTPEGTAQP